MIKYKYKLNVPCCTNLILILDHSQIDTQQLPLRHEKEEVYFVQLSRPSTYPEADITQHQDAFNSILVTTWSDGLFKALFWNLLVHRIVYPYFGEPNSNNQVTLSNNLILLIVTILAHNDSTFQHFSYESSPSQAHPTYSKTITTTATQILAIQSLGLSTSSLSISEQLNVLLRHLVPQHNHSSKLATTSAIKKYCNSLDTTLPSLTSCCTTIITSIMKSDQTASTELSRDPTKSKNSPDSSLVVIVKRL